MLRKIEGKKRRGQQRTRWLDDITDSMDKSLRKLRDGEEQGGLVCSSHGITKSQTVYCPRTAACQASLSITNSQNLVKLTCIKLVMPSNNLILCRPLLLPLSIFPRIRVFSSESVLHIRWPIIGVLASASVLPMNIQD